MALPELRLVGARADEGDGVEFTLELLEESAFGVTFDYRTVSGTAQGGVDFHNLANKITFNAGQTTKTVRVNTVNPADSETDEWFGLEVFNPVGATFGGTNQSLRATGWILDNDPGGDKRAIAVSAPVVAESGGVAEFRVSVSRPFATATELDFATVDGSALAGTDYVARSGKVRFEAGQTEAVVPVTLRNDSVAEPGESFGLKVSGAGLDGFGWASLLDPDGSLPVVSIEGDRTGEGQGAFFTIRLSEAAASAVSLDYRAVSGTAQGGVDFHNLASKVTFAAGETTKVVRVNTVNPADPEADEWFSLEVFNPVGATFGATNRSLRATGWILDNDAGADKQALAASAPVVAESGGVAEFRVSVSRPFATATDLDFATVDGSALAGTDYVARSGKVRFEAGQTEAVVRVTLRNDSVTERGESFGLKVSGAGLDGFGWASLLDPDARLPVVSIEGDRTGEGQGAFFTIRLSEAARSAVSLDYRAVSGTAQGGVDFHNLASKVTFAAGETTKVVRVNTVNPADSETDEWFGLEVSNPVGATLGGPGPSLRATGWILDNDAGGEKRAISISGDSVSEAGGRAFAHFQVSLSRPAEERLRISYETVDGTAKAGSDYRAESGRMTIEAGATEGYISVAIRDNLALESTEAFSVRLRSPFPDDIAPGGVSARATARIFDGTIRGTARADDLEGTNRADRIEGLGGNDRLAGLRGNDILVGGSGRDRLSGGPGDDILIGGSGRDRLSGGPGDDTFLFASAGAAGKGSTRDTIVDFVRGDDLIDLRGIDGNTGRRGNQPLDFIGSKAFSDKAGELRLAGHVLSGDVNGDGRADFQIGLPGVDRLGDADFLL